MQNIIQPINEIVMPAGKYWIGDPCYVLSETNYRKFIEDKNAVHYGSCRCDKIECGLFAVLNNHPIVSLDTLHGDGTYQGIFVDSGMIGAVPVALIERKGAHTDYGKFENFENDFGVGRDEDGVLSFGNFCIETDYEDYDRESGYGVDDDDDWSEEDYEDDEE